MKTRTAFPLLTALATCLLLAACSSGNPYMKRGNEKFEAFTSKLLGEWDIASYSLKGDEKIGRTYAGGKLVFDEPEPGDRRGQAVFTLPLSAETIRTMSDEWKKKWPELKVETYNVIVVSHWQISKDGRVLFLEDPLVSAEITGKGKGINDLIGWENGKLQSTSVAQAGDGRRGFAFGKIMQATSGISSYYPELPAQSRFSVASNTLETTSNFRINLKMKR